MKLFGKSKQNNGYKLYRGRVWVSAYLVFMGTACLIAAIGLSFYLGWLAFLMVGLPSLFAVYMCFSYGYGEAIAKVELRGDGFSLRLPSYRGYFPFPPLCQLTGGWDEVTAIRRAHVNATMLGVSLGYIAHTFETNAGGVVLLEPRPNELSRNSRKSSLNIPARLVAEEFVQRALIVEHYDGEFDGGGLWQNLFRPISSVSLKTDHS